jgi:hypothetical protein
MKAGILIDTWKLPIFEKHLSQVGFIWEQTEGITKDTLLLKVQTDNVAQLDYIVRVANREAARRRKI